MGVVPVHSLPVKGHGLQETRGLGYNERPTTGTALLAVCMAYIVMLVGVQGMSSREDRTRDSSSHLSLGQG